MPNRDVLRDGEVSGDFIAVDHFLYVRLSSLTCWHKRLCFALAKPRYVSGRKA